MPDLHRLPKTKLLRLNQRQQTMLDDLTTNEIRILRRLLPTAASPIRERWIQQLADLNDIRLQLGLPRIGSES